MPADSRSGGGAPFFCVDPAVVSEPRVLAPLGAGQLGMVLLRQASAN